MTDTSINSRGRKRARFSRPFQPNSRFVMLPTEIKRDIFSHLDVIDLFESKLVCSKWLGMITQLLDIKRTELPAISSAMSAMWGRYDISEETSFKKYKAPYRLKNVVDEAVISSLVNCKVSDVVATEFLDAYRKIDERNRVGYYFSDSKLCKELTWSMILRITGLHYSIDEIMELKSKDKFPLILQTKYEWYVCSWEFDDISMTCIIALYPDKQTFVMFEYYDGFDSESESEDVSDTSDSYDSDAEDEDFEPIDYYEQYYIDEEEGSRLYESSLLS